MLHVELHKQLGAFQLDVAFETDGDILALLGASGCGKSMTLKCIAGIETPDWGHIALDGHVLFDSQRRINLPFPAIRAVSQYDSPAEYPRRVPPKRPRSATG